jgi:hypothetical protein
MLFYKRYLASLAVFLAVILVFTAGCTSTTPATTPVSTGAATTSTSAAVSPQNTPPASPLNVVGVWTGTTTGHTSADGFRETNTPQYNITAQKGVAFTGYKDYTRADGKVYHENLSGVLSVDGKIYIAGETSDVMFGDVIGPNEVEFKLLQPGEDAKALVIRLTRQKI